MKIAVPSETAAGESRVAVSPDAVKAYVKKGLTVCVEQGAGAGSFMSDDAFKAAGAKIAKGAAVLKDADIVLAVRRLPDASLKSLKKGAIVAAQLDPYGDRKNLDAMAKQGVSAFSMELVPRITRAQSMDVLSSQANLAGYKAVIDAAEHFSRAFPMMMTAAGTVPAARVFVMGAGVAGLQAIATARRLGAVVSATDVRAAAGEQVASLGAKFVFVEGMADAATEGGYAKELSAEDKKKQAELVADHIKGQDIVITTALIPGRPAPVLVTKQMVESMKAGSIIVDMAVERGGNCPLSKPGQIVDHKGVAIMGHENLPGKLAGNASTLYAKNLQNFVDLMVSPEGEMKLDWEDEIITGCGLMRDGEIVHAVLTEKKGN
ncbi:Re/Si-specific NAD(P)(+) transhydrogenase subunit alpha [Anderseniella sp. Alg231-50]|uniref:Re/Si-specific NAD(P)(+) transhydrogenase subunit alpha n=1 Tax=Anderseniella sp. Alg231-50 TaxID=1922226 RepID=UPI000D5524B9